MVFDLIVSENCCACERVERVLREFISLRDYIKFKIAFRNTTSFNTSIVPSLFINGTLFAYGEIDIKRLDEKVNFMLKENCELKIEN